ncbi:MAG: phage major capsid protein, partial [Rhodospirillaceae bacterium]
PTELRDERGRVLSRIDDIIETARAEGRTELTDAERSEHDDLVSQAAKLGEDITRAEGAVGDALRFAAHDARLDPPAANPVVSVGNEPTTYNPGADHSFFVDAYRSRFLGDDSANQRLQRHGVEVSRNEGIDVSRDVGTSAFGALVVPQYLTELYAPLARAGRPFANICMSLPLPDEGMTLNIPRGTTGTAAAAQATENSGVQETDFDETTLAVSVRTYAGQQDVSRQALERGRGIDQIIYADLAADYATKVDAALLMGAGTNGTHLGVTEVSSINAVTYTDNDPTVAEFWPKLHDAIQKVNSNRYLPPTVIVMHPRRWGWIQAGLTSSLPIAAQSGAPVNSVAVNQAVAYGQVVGNIAGLPVVTDANIATDQGAGTEDSVLVLRAEDMLLWEQGDGSPRELRFEETTAGSLTTKLVVYGYSAFAGGRYPKAVAEITGTGLIAPTF